MNDLKVFEINWKSQGEKEWVGAFTNVGAMLFYLEEFSHDISVFSPTDEINEVPKEKWAEMIITNSDYDETDPEDWEKKTFEEFMKDQVGECVIAGTPYE